jgi:hypothetical protein
MRVSDLINTLQDLQRKYGNLPVLIQSEGQFGGPNGVNVMRPWENIYQIVIHADDSYNVGPSST